ncbi:MAG: hypothetical protein Q9168_002100 [Polycauliona sp. 1 TL-2023]
MYPCNPSILYLLCVVQLLFHFVASQLLGSITRLDNQYRLVVSISNPTNDTISILGWNNIFDSATPSPIPLVIRDDQGVPLRMATTYAMRAGMNDSDFYHLDPKAPFQRYIDLRSLLQVVPPGRSGKITVALPGGFTGMSHTGEWTPPAAAAANFTTNPPQLGDFSAAQLQDISLTSRRLTLELKFPVPSNDGIVDSIARNPLVQIQVDDSCRDRKGTDMVDALNDTANYASAISLAASDQYSSLFGNFFLSPSRGTVAAVASLAQKVISDQGPQVGLNCTDLRRICDRYPNILGYTTTPANLGPAEMVICPATRKLPRPAQPCSTPAGIRIGATAAYVVMHLILTINSIFTDTITGSVYGSGSCQTLKSSRIFATSKNPDSYAQLAIAQYGYGLGGPPYNGTPCPPSLGVLPNIQ